MPHGIFRLPPRKTLWLSRHAKEFWFRYLPSSQTLFVQYNAVQGPRTSLVDALRKRAARRGVQRVVIDLRHNGGGDNSSYNTFLAALRRAPFNRPRRLYVLLGRLTFSAAGNFATEVDLQTRATFAGEPMGGGLNQYGQGTVGDPVAPPHPDVGAGRDAVLRVRARRPAAHASLPRSRLRSARPTSSPVATRRCGPRSRTRAGDETARCFSPASPFWACSRSPGRSSPPAGRARKGIRRTPSSWARDGGLYEVTVSPRPEESHVNRLHSWRLEVRDGDGQPVTDAVVKVDGDMPGHGHGLPTRPQVRSTSATASTSSRA